MNYRITLLGFLLLLCSVTGAVGQSGPALVPQVHLLATEPHTSNGVSRLLSLWEVPFPKTQKTLAESFRIGPHGELAGIDTPPNTAFVLIDSELKSPFSGNLLWVLPSLEYQLPQDMIDISGSIAWHSGEQHAYIAIAHSGASWVRLIVYETALIPKGLYSPLSASTANALEQNVAIPEALATWKSDNLHSQGLFQASEVQTLVEPESLVIHMVDANTLRRINAPSPTQYAGQLDLRLDLHNHIWSNITRRQKEEIGPFTVRGVMNRGEGKAGDPWTLTLDEPIEVHDAKSADPVAMEQISRLRFAGPNGGRQNPSYAGRHVELTGTILTPVSGGTAIFKIEAMSVLE